MWKKILCRILLAILILVFVTEAEGKCHWASADSSWHQSENGQWLEFSGTHYEKTFTHYHTVYPGESASVLQQNRFLSPLVLDSKSAYYGNNKFASGHWTAPDLWEGQWFWNHGGGSGYYTKEGNTWKEYRRGRYQKTFQHIQTIDNSQFAVILQQFWLWPFILTDHFATYNGVSATRGRWIHTCFWRGKRSDGYTTSEFRRVSPSAWKEYNNGDYLKTFDHIQTIADEGNVVVIQQHCREPFLLSNTYAYNSSVLYATGAWNSPTEWIGRRLCSNELVSFVRTGTTWAEYKEGGYMRMFRHIQSVPSGLSVVVLQQNCLWPLIIADFSASYNGEIFARGYWDASENVPECSTQISRKRRDLFDAPILCQFRHDSGNSVNVTLRGYDSNGRITPPPSNRIRNDASDAIAQLTAADLSREQTTVVTEGSVRIDIQGGMNFGGQRYVNVQVQTNGQTSSTLAHTNCPNVGSLIRDVRRALLYSMNRSFIVTLQYIN